MKLEFDLDERKYLYGTFKLIAMSQRNTKEKIFYNTMAETFKKNVGFAHYKRPHVTLLLDIITGLLDTLNTDLAKVPEDDLGLRAKQSNVIRILEGAKAKVDAKLSDVTEGEKDGI